MTRLEYEADLINRAAYFTVARFEGSGRFTKSEHASLEEARTHAAAMGRGKFGQRPMIYAVTAAGRSTMIGDDA